MLSYFVRATLLRNLQPYYYTVRCTFPTPTLTNKLYIRRESAITLFQTPWCIMNDRETHFLPSLYEFLSNYVRTSAPCPYVSYLLYYYYRYIRS